jgi:thermolysin metallopeptidase-like protein/thrombospondin type 3 repeat protein
MRARLTVLSVALILSAHYARAQSIDPAPADFVALQHDSSVPLTGSTEAGTVRLVSFSVPAQGISPVEQAQAFLASYGAIFGQSGPDQRLVVRKVQKSPGPVGLQVVSFLEQYKGVPVFGAGLRVGIETSPFTGLVRVVFAGGVLLPDPALEGGLDVRPSVSPDACVATAQAHLARPGAVALADPKLMIYDARLAGGTPGSHLVWAVTLGDGPTTQVLCDAHTASFVFERSFVYDALDLWLGLQFPNPQHVFLGDESGLTLFGQTFQEALIEWNHAHTVHNFFAGNFFWWPGTQGDDNQLQLLIQSNRTQFYHDPFGENISIATDESSLDATAHEFGHGIIHHTSDLTYSGVPGALNEGYADAMGMLIDNQDWLLGEDAPKFKGSFIRNFADPSQKGSFPAQPDQFSELCTSNMQCNYTNDSNGVHTNSGILNKAHYLMATGDAFNGRPAFTGVSIGRWKMGVLAFNVMRLLSSSATFQDARAMSVSFAQKAANNSWFGFTASDVCAVKDAFSAVEIGPGDFNCDGVDDNFQDPDGDFVPSSIDNCPIVWNPDQKNFDNDADGDACDNDFDNDKRPNGQDNCFSVPNWDQANNDKFPYGSCGADGLGDACDADDDNDGVLDSVDNCPKDCNPGQEDGNGSNGGDACDPDYDGDGHYESSGDNCPCVYNPAQSDLDGDGLGDACDLCPFTFDTPNAYGLGWQCPVPRPIQWDSDDDGIGDACDSLGFGEVAFDLNGVPADPSRMPAPNGEPTFGRLTGPPGRRLRIPVPLCSSAAGGVSDPPELTEIAFGDLDPEIGASLVDDDGLVLGGIRPGPAGSNSRGLRVSPDCTRTYYLKISLGPAFDGSDDFLLRSFFPDPSTPNPYVTPGLGLPPAPPIPDADGDGLPDASDTCPTVFDPTGADADEDGLGDVCDSCSVGGVGSIVGVELNPQPFPPAPATIIQWDADTRATSYDVVYGDLRLLHDGAGFAAAVLGCLSDNGTSTSVTTGIVPAPSQALFFLVRGTNCQGPGTWDEGSASQSGSRDPGINASPMSCTP